MAMEQHRHDMSDRAWEKIRSYAIGEKGHAEEMPVIHGSLSTVYSGAFVPGYLGGTCQKRTETGRMYTAGFAGGVTRESGKGSWKPWWMTQTLNG